MFPALLIIGQANLFHQFYHNHHIAITLVIQNKSHATSLQITHYKYLLEISNLSINNQGSTNLELQQS